jgi:hypothetical protein
MGRWLVAALVSTSCHASVPHSAQPTVDACVAVFEHELHDLDAQPVFVSSRDRTCRRAARTIENDGDVRAGVPHGPLRPACPGRSCGPHHGTLLIVDPEPSSGAGCFGVWRYHGTGGSKRTVCHGHEGFRDAGPLVVY